MRVFAHLLLGFAALSAASAASYHGYQVISVNPSTHDEVRLVESLIEVYNLQEWTHSRSPGVSMDVLVPPRSVSVLLSTLQKLQLPATVKINDVQRVINQQTMDQQDLQTLPRAFDHTKYHRLNEIYSILDAVETDSSLVTTYTAGTTYEGRDIRVAKVSSGGAKQAVWIECGIHAREWIAPATCQYILDQLTSGSNDATELLNTYDFHIMPVVNPDGYEYTWTSDRLWRKNRVPYGDFGCHGVDPNRNFDSHFGGPGTSNNACSDIYHGPSAFSERESQAVRDSINAMDAKMFFCIHSYSQLWMMPYGYTYDLPENYNEQYRVAGEGVQALQNVHGTYYDYGNIANIIYMAAGGSSDWAYDGAGIPYAFALELRDTGSYGFLLPASQILPTGEETWAGIVAAIKATK